MRIVVAAAAALVASGAAAQSVPFESDAPRLEEMTLGEWQGTALADPASGGFAACVVGVTDRGGGASLNFWMAADGNLRVHLHGPGLALEPGATVPLEVSFNRSRRRAEVTTGEAVTPQAIAIADGDDMERRFRRSRSAEIASPYGTVGFSLRSSNQAMRWLERCAARFAGSAVEPTMPVAAAEPEEPVVPVVSQLDAVVLLANALSAAEIAGFALDTGAEEETVRFTAPAASGSIRALHPGETADLDGLRFDLLAESAAACRGRYSAENMVADGPVSLRIATSCDDDAVAHREVAVLSGAVGSLVATIEGAAPNPAVADALLAALAARLAGTATADAAPPAPAEPVAEGPPDDVATVAAGDAAALGSGAGSP